MSDTKIVGGNLGEIAHLRALLTSCQGNRQQLRAEVERLNREVFNRLSRLHPDLAFLRSEMDKVVRERDEAQRKLTEISVAFGDPIEATEPDCNVLAERVRDLQTQTKEALAQVAVLSQVLQQYAGDFLTGTAAEEVLANLPTEARTLLDRLQRAAAAVESLHGIVESALRGWRGSLPNPNVIPKEMWRLTQRQNELEIIDLLRKADALAAWDAGKS